MFSEPLLAHPAEIGGVHATWHSYPADDDDRTQHDDDADAEQHGFSHFGRHITILTRGKVTVCALVHTASGRDIAMMWSPLSKQKDHQRERTAGRDNRGNRDDALLEFSVVFNTFRHPCGPAFFRGDALCSRVRNGLSSHQYIFLSSGCPNCSLTHGLAESADGNNPRRHQRRFQKIGVHVLSVRTRIGNRCSRLHIIRREPAERRRGFRAVSVEPAKESSDPCRVR
jgi:hypothetical protein